LDYIYEGQPLVQGCGLNQLIPDIATASSSSSSSSAAAAAVKQAKQIL